MMIQVLNFSQTFLFSCSRSLAFLQDARQGFNDLQLITFLS